MRVLEERIGQLIVRIMELERKVGRGEEEWRIRCSWLSSSSHGKP
jgi:hypothetical protein